MKRKRNGKRSPAATQPAPLQLWHPEVPGPLWDGTRRVPRKQIESYCRVLAREFHPQKIILFGSYAYGKPTLDSDVDLVVVMPFRGSDTKKVVEMQLRVGAPFPMDMLLWKPERAKRTDYFTREVLDRGQVIYEARNA
ncbi:MAG: nucleotidyltransferase domain-containing protein [Verrucomicrobiae bacterium]|nr:nucleotidyltransferase domain-containing protein [Verrucomicrobiae bacterium]